MATSYGEKRWLGKWYSPSKSRVADRARGDEVGARDAELLEGGEQIPVVGERDAHGIVDGEVALHGAVERSVRRWLDGLAGLPGEGVAGALGDGLAHVGDAGVARHRGAARGEKERSSTGEEVEGTARHGAFPFEPAA